MKDNFTDCVHWTATGNGVVTNTFQYTLTNVNIVHLSHVHITGQPTRIIEYLQFRYTKFAITNQGSSVTYDVTANTVS
jgi:type VI protein secretion system component Hcp